MDNGYALTYGLMAFNVYIGGVVKARGVPGMPSQRVIKEFSW